MFCEALVITPEQCIIGKCQYLPIAQREIESDHWVLRVANRPTNGAIWRSICRRKAEQQVQYCNCRIREKKHLDRSLIRARGAEGGRNDTANVKISALGQVWECSRRWWLVIGRAFRRS